MERGVGKLVRKHSTTVNFVTLYCYLSEGCANHFMTMMKLNQLLFTYPVQSYGDDYGVMCDISASISYCRICEYKIL